MSTGYGSDIWTMGAVCQGRYARGRQLLLQACYNRLSTPRGTVRGGEEEAVYGLDLSEYVGAMEPRIAAAAFPSLISGELCKDDRVRSVRTTVVVVDDGAGLYTLHTTIGIDAFDEALSGQLTLDVSQAGVVFVPGGSTA